MGNLGVDANIVCAGEIFASNLKPFWLAGKVGANGGLITSRGRWQFTSRRMDVGRYEILTDPDHPFPITEYIVQLTCQCDQLNGVARVATGTTTGGFVIATYIAGSAADCAFYVTVIN